MKLKNLLKFISEAQKPRFRANLDGTFTPVPASTATKPKRKRAPAKKRKMQAHIQTHDPFKKQQPISNLERSSVDFDVDKIGKVERPVVQQRAGQRRIVPDRVQQAALKQKLKARQAARSKSAQQRPNIPGTPPPNPSAQRAAQAAQQAANNTPQAIYKRVGGMIEKAGANRNVQLLDQILQILNNVQQSGFSRVGLGGKSSAPNQRGVDPRKEIEADAQRIYKRTLRGTPEHQRAVMQRVQQLMKTGGR